MAEEQKAIDEMTDEECLEELKELSEQVVFDQKFSKKTPLEELRVLVKEGREVLEEPADPADAQSNDEEDAKKPAEDKEATPPKGAGKPPAKAAEKAPEISSRRVDGPITVIVKKTGQGRTYSRATHGEHYRTLAKQYAENDAAHGGAVMVEGK